MPALRRLFVERFSLIDRYMLREFLISLIAVIGVLWLIYVATRFARYLAQAAVGNLPAEVIFNLLWLNSFGAISILLPIGTFLAVLLSLSRMSSDNELTVIAACGIDGNRILRNVVVFSGAMAIITGVLALLIVPDVLSGRYEIEQKAKIAANTTGLVAGSFKESQDGDWTFYSQQLSEDKTHMENIFIEIHRDEKPLIFRAERGRFDIESETGDIIRITNVFNRIKEKKRLNIRPVGFVVGLKNIYLTTNNGRLIVIDVLTGKPVLMLKIDNESISMPFILDKNLFIIKDNAIIKLN